MKYYITLLINLLFITLTKAQSIPEPTSSADRLKAFTQRKSLADESLFSHLAFENIGPTIFSGRIVDVDVNPNRPTEMYVAYASGGVWYTNNNGTSFTPIFDREACMTVGDIAVNWTDHVIWVGTGENNSSRSSYSGIGVYKSTDRGKTWKHMGLNESHHIGRIVLHPFNPNVIHVACIGALYSDNTYRGVYSTSDGGLTWRQSLFINDATGVIDLIIDPHNPNQLYAASWERSRRAWNFTESGPGSGIYKSDDGGRHWTLLTTTGSGFPTGKGTGRIGLELVRDRNQTILYAIIDNQHERPEKKKEDDVLTKAELMEMPADSFLKLSDKRIKDYLNENDFPSKYTTDTLRTLVKNGTIIPATLAEYTMNANSKLFETEVTGTEVYKSTDEGRSWTRTHQDYLDHVFYTYGYYFGQIRASKSKPGTLYLLGVPILKSSDGGATWKSIGGDNVHADHHALWVNPKLDGHLICGNDGGLNISYDDGEHWIKCNSPSVGQFYSVSVDNATPFNVYGGLQDNGVWVGPSNYKASSSWQAYGQYPYREIMGGDGMQTVIDSRDNNTLITGYQFGNYYKTSRDGSINETRITPSHEINERPYRFNWESPIHLSVHNQDILYMGGEKVFRTMDQGKSWKAISPDLTHGEKEGDVAYGTLVSLYESPRVFGLIYTGSDDGRLHVTRNGGISWEEVSDGLPSQMWVSSVQSSYHADGRVYMSLNGYRWDHFNSYVYRSDDYGLTWTRIGTNLPAEPVNVIKEDPHNEDILYIGTDHALYISLDKGHSVMLFGDMPFVPVHDIAIQPRDRVLVAATHGRSVYKVSLKHVQRIIPSKSDSLTAFNEVVSVYYNERWGSRSANWMKYSEPKISIPVFSGMKGDAEVLVMADSVLVARKTLHLEKGLKYYEADLTFDDGQSEYLQSRSNKEAKTDEKITLKKADNEKYYLPPGKYTLSIHQNNQFADATLEVKKRN